MACSNVFDAFAVPTQSFDQDLFARASAQSVMLNLVPRGEYKSGTGLTQTTFLIENQEPSADEETWSAIVQTSGSTTSACDNSYVDANVGYTARTYSPEQFDLRGPVLCKDELIYDYNPASFLAKYLQKLAVRAMRSWDNRYLKIYMDQSRKVICDGVCTMTDAGATFTQEIATSELTQQILDDVVVPELIYEGATEPDGEGWINLGPEGPQWPLLINPTVSNHILTNSAALRTDVNYAFSGQGRGSELMKRVGAGRVFKNFRHVPWVHPARFTYNGTAYSRVNTYESSAATKGYKSTLTAAWKAAPYEAAIVLNPNVFTSEIVRPVNAAAGLNWNPTNTLGEWQWVTGAYKWDTDCVDPHNKKGRHFAEFRHAPRVERPEFGVVLIYKRCPGTNFDRVYCT